MRNIRAFLLMERALTLFEQLDLLIDKGLILDINKEEALSFLTENNFYRLLGYLDYCLKNYDRVTFNKLKEIYIFDFDLRRILNDLLEEAEIITKTQIAYNLSLNLSPYFYLDETCFYNNDYQRFFLDKVEEVKVKNTLLYNSKNYIGELIPIWVLVEAISFGTISKMFSNLNNKYKSFVCGKTNYYKYHYKAFQSYLYTSVQLRNICAHRGRLYGIRLNANPSLSHQDKILFERHSYPIKTSGSTCSIFIAIYSALRLLNDESSRKGYINKLSSLFNQYKDLDVKPLGFYNNWKPVLWG